MPNAYNLEYFPPRNRGNSNLIRQRHAIYHFFNTANAGKPVWSMSPDFFYKNNILKNGSHHTPEEKRRRLLNLVGGSPRRLYTILAGTLNSRHKNINRTFRNEGAKSAHLGQLAFYNRLFRIAFPVFPGVRHHDIRLPRVARPENRVPNEELYGILRRYYHEVTLPRGTERPENRYRNLRTRFPVNERLTNIRQRTTQREVAAATKIQSIYRGVMTRRRTASTRGARTKTVPHRHHASASKKVYIPPHRRRASASKK